jgi:hypothetical protein
MPATWIRFIVIIDVLLGLSERAGRAQACG